MKANLKQVEFWAMSNDVNSPIINSLVYDEELSQNEAKELSELLNALWLCVRRL